MKKDEILTALGFQFQQARLRHTHPLTGAIEFDFSANSIEGIVNTICNAGYNKGREDFKNAFKRLMD